MRKITARRLKQTENSEFCGTSAPTPGASLVINRRWIFENAFLNRDESSSLSATQLHASRGESPLTPGVIYVLVRALDLKRHAKFITFWEDENKVHHLQDFSPALGTLCPFCRHFKCHACLEVSSSILAAAGVEKERSTG
jgi:hypothetical protein